MAGYYPNHESEYYEASASSNPMNLKLIFSDDVSSPAFTKQKITGKASGNESIKVHLVDSKTGRKVIAGPVASAKVKIVLVRANYDGEFEKNIVYNWGKKKNLLQGDVDVYLEHGSGAVGEIRIQHDKHPIKTVELRLGATVVDCPYEYEIKQAITQPFIVKDLRNAPKSFRSLLPTDKVWKMKNIGKYGVIHKRLENSNVFTVMDFLNMYSSNRQALQEIYGGRGRKWETTVTHAKTCNVGNAPVRLASISEGLNNMPAFDDDCYFPLPGGNDLYDKEMIWDENFSIQDVGESDMDVWFHDQGLVRVPCPAYREDGIFGTSNMVGHYGEGKRIKAKKRWMKMRTLFFSIASFICVCHVKSCRNKFFVR